MDLRAMINRSDTSCFPLHPLKDICGHAQYTQTIVSRDYVIEQTEGTIKHLVLSTLLGIGLIDGYDKSFRKPQLCREMEHRMVQVCK
ncbi:uncharacterized protein LACBIDRAFT_299642 [Laccaria bicolor S238N-H82]|uniref:Predicted protein n=1 Tax=Laccaria bicolor (strain S238N-H82 / ATCC MYA-4686) TaxID=486041 RepID=B0DF26_LACBS|nr:uncharacterized protein LACBIDRAFT_299642 [Laccaria bicolor S238N-H82]EDR06776.1 predicted protein [Laccaria bicolor S238N-H82]|eukprot:XP_001882623.1 predicted protein [Laccaria bicolor S238N-H82]